MEVLLELFDILLLTCVLHYHLNVENSSRRLKTSFCQFIKYFQQLKMEIASNGLL